MGGRHADMLCRDVALGANAVNGIINIIGRSARSTTGSISLSGTNLLHDRHLELTVPYGEYIDRSLFARADWSLQ